MDITAFSEIFDTLDREIWLITSRAAIANPA